MMSQMMIQTYLLAAQQSGECQFSDERGAFEFSDSLKVYIQDEGFCYEVLEEQEVGDDLEFKAIEQGDLKNVAQLKGLINRLFYNE